MSEVTACPMDVLGLSFPLLLTSIWMGALLPRMLPRRWWPDSTRRDFVVIQVATLTLLGLIIGVTFSMALSSYDQRKHLEQAEADAVGTEFLRAALLPGPVATQVRAVLADYLDQRILYYTTHDELKVKKVNVRTAELQTALWTAVAGLVVWAPSPTMNLVATGMNDVLNAEASTKAAWGNRIPGALWILMLTTGVLCHLLVGCGVKDPMEQRTLMFMLPLIISIAFMLIADIDSPRSGAVLVQPANLERLVQSARPR